MPETTTCPDCGRKLRVPDELIGKKVKCPDCKVKFTAGITPAPAKSKTEDEEQRIASTPRGNKAARPKRDEEEDDDERPSPRGRTTRTTRTIVVRPA